MAVKMSGLSLDLLSHPGETLKEVLESNNMTQKELAARIGISQKHLNLIISGQQGISAETAFKLEKVFSLSASFWNNLQRQYDEEKMAILEEQQILDEEKNLYDANVYSQIVSYGYLPKETKIERKIIQCRGFFGVSNLLNVAPTIKANALFRKSMNVTTNEFALAAWMKICEIETDAITVQTGLDLQKLKSKLNEIKQLNTLSDPNVIVDRLEKIFSECGVAFAVVRNIKGAPVQGFIRKINNKVRLCVTLRNKYSDIFWFTLFHEIGHLLDTRNEFFVDFNSADRSIAERAADEFATQQLIDKIAYSQFVRGHNFSRASVIRFAEQNGVLPGILVGRLHHDGYLPNSQFNDLRTQYCWAEAE